MERVSADQIAKAAGVEPSYVAGLIGEGILEPDEDGLLSERDVRRVRIVQTLEDAGLPLAGLGEAVRSGVVSLAFIDSPSYDRWGSFSETTFQSLSTDIGVPVELLTVIREAMGSAAPRSDDRVRVDEMLVVPMVQMQHQLGFRPEVIERALRVYGDSLRRVAETESDWWYSEVMMPILRSAKAPAEVLKAVAATSEELSPALATVGDSAIMAVYHGQQTHAWIRNILEGFEAALAAAGIHSRLKRFPAMCFFDLTGYTRLTEERGDEAAAGLARNLASLVQRNSVQYGGKAVKFLGDGVMFHFPEPGKGVLAALDMVEAAVSVGLPPAHVGLHAGPVLFQEGDYFGRTVNISARIADYARPGEVLVSQEVVEGSGDVPVAYADIGHVELKGVSGPVHLYKARPGD
ncbi:MAG TPA: adenylate/guanylate cyclase domain-containing protein [Acidimicrobiia bacterium]|nr:adenylate/guanylate cyclase domain-containing protein [Acidimicrobiia bacterium]